MTERNYWREPNELLRILILKSMTPDQNGVVHLALILQGELLVIELVSNANSHLHHRLVLGATGTPDF